MALDSVARAALDQLADLLATSERAVVLTGAGVSTESGLPDYRGAQGLWRNKGFADLASIETFRADPAEFWAFYRERLHVLRDAAPNKGHEALARLEAQGRIRALVTQNVDGLHRVAGSRNVHEVHGTLSELVCLSCRAKDRESPHLYPSDDLDSFNDPDGLPRCPRCGTILKPNVVLFGELLPEAMDVASAYVAEADLLIALGSSLAVYPVALFPHWVKSQGGRLAIVNQGETEADYLADVRVDAPTGAALPYLLEQLEQADQAV